ncbi:hypothetical protein LBMAG18_12500 [Alphaproteobacteria bacterium]|nr:hypothetical protein LBMAG18_12500 [Alphaproteobacteria bacterium]
MFCVPAELAGDCCCLVFGKLCLDVLGIADIRKTKSTKQTATFNFPSIIKLYFDCKNLLINFPVGGIEIKAPKKPRVDANMLS